MTDDVSCDDDTAVTIEPKVAGSETDSKKVRVPYVVPKVNDGDGLEAWDRIVQEYDAAMPDHDGHPFSFRRATAAEHEALVLRMRLLRARIDDRINDHDDALKLMGIFSVRCVDELPPDVQRIFTIEK